MLTRATTLYAAALEIYSFNIICTIFTPSADNINNPLISGQPFNFYNWWTPSDVFIAEGHRFSQKFTQNMSQEKLCVQINTDSYKTDIMGNSLDFMFKISAE